MLTIGEQYLKYAGDKYDNILPSMALCGEAALLQSSFVPKTAMFLNVLIFNI